MDAETKDLLVQLVSEDHGLSPDQKMTLISKLNDPTFSQKLLHGATGAAIAFGISKYLNLSNPTQILLSLAGFGIGRMLWDHVDNNKYLTYNKERGSYSVKL